METMEQLLKEAIESYKDSPTGEIREKDTAYCKIELHCDKPFKAVRDSAIDAGTILEEDEEKGIVNLLILTSRHFLSPLDAGPDRRQPREPAPSC